MSEIFINTGDVFSSRVVLQTPCYVAADAPKHDRRLKELYD